MGSYVWLCFFFVVFVSFVLFVVKKFKLTGVRAGGHPGFFWIPAKSMRE